MKKLLEQDFIITHKDKINGEFKSIVVKQYTSSFDLIDRDGGGQAMYSNSNNYVVNTINYEFFFKSLEWSQDGIKNCDFILYTDNKMYFLLNELTKTNKSKGAKRVKAIKQMRDTLELLIAVPAINDFITKHTVKECCYFNKKSQRPRQLQLIEAFSKIDNVNLNGFEANEKRINDLGFEFREFSGGKEYVLN